MYFHSKSIANVLSFSKISKLYRITFDNSVGNCFVVHGKNRKVLFRRSANGLFYHDSSKNAPPSPSVPKETSLVQTVKGNEAAFTHRQVSQARLARKLYITMGRPSHAYFVAFIRTNQLKNCPIDVDGANRSLTIYRPDASA